MCRGRRKRRGRQRLPCLVSPHLARKSFQPGSTDFLYRPNPISPTARTISAPMPMTMAFNAFMVFPALRYAPYLLVFIVGGAILVKRLGIGRTIGHKCCMSDTRDIMLSVAAVDAGTRLDKWLTENADNLSRTRVQALINDGHVTGPDGIANDMSRKVRAGESYTLSVPPPTPARPVAEDIPLDVLFEDEHLIVLVKPAGLVVHPAPGHASGTLVNALLHHCRGSLSGIGGVTRPGIVHRLDKDTSGVMVCAKSDIAHRGLVDQFQVHSIDRAYMAVVWGMPKVRARASRKSYRTRSEEPQAHGRGCFRGQTSGHGLPRYQTYWCRRGINGLPFIHRTDPSNPCSNVINGSSAGGRSAVSYERKWAQRSGCCFPYPGAFTRTGLVSNIPPAMRNSNSK